MVSSPIGSHRVGARIRLLNSGAIENRKSAPATKIQKQPDAIGRWNLACET